MSDQTPKFSPDVVLQAAREECHRLRMENETLTARCEALEKLRDRLLVDVRTETALWLASEERCEALTAERDKTLAATGHQLADLATLVQTYDLIQSRCQHLEQAVKAALAISTDDYIEELQQIRAALASLLPAQEEGPQTDENRLSFAAGYSQAIDDVAQDGELKGTK